MSVDLIMLALANATIVLTVTRSSLFMPVRDALEDVPFVGTLVSCPWCFAHWSAPALMLLVQPPTWGTAARWIIEALALVVLTAPIAFVGFKAIGGIHRGES